MARITGGTERGPLSMGGQDPKSMKIVRSGIQQFFFPYFETIPMNVGH